MELLFEFAATAVLGFVLVGIYFLMLDWLAEERLKERRMLRLKQRLSEPVRELPILTVYKK